MMTVAEAELMRRAAEKGRSASFCAPGQPHLALAAAYSSHEISDMSGHAQAFALLNEAQCDSGGSPVLGNQSPRTRLRVSSGGNAARRSQSCRVQGSRPPRGKQRESPKGSGHNLNVSEEAYEGEMTQAQGQGPGSRRGSCSSGLLKKVPSCGRLVALSADVDDLNGSPILRRTASARRALPQTSSPNHSPTPTRGTRPSTQKGRQQSRKTVQGSTKRPPGGGYLDVKGSAETLDADAYLLRNFSTTHKGFINRGDSFRRRRSRSNSIQPPSDGSFPSTPNTSTFQLPHDHAPTPPLQDAANTQAGEDEEHTGINAQFRVAMIGSAGVGKTALINQFQTSECINAFDCCSAEDGEPTTSISIVLNNAESEITFMNVATPHEFNEVVKSSSPPDGWMVVYSITDKISFQKANEELVKLQSSGLLRGKALIIVANKCELVRSRAVQMEDGRDMAVSFGGKFMEISVGMNHKCDDLLVGTIRQLRFKLEAFSGEEEVKEHVPWTRNRSLMRASMKAKRVMHKIMGKSDSKNKNCEDFGVL